MARINMSNIIREKVCGTYAMFEDDGEKFVQIDTYGTDHRDILEKASQSFQFEKESAAFIIELLSKEFNIR